MRTEVGLESAAKGPKWKGPGRAPPPTGAEPSRPTTRSDARAANPASRLTRITSTAQQVPAATNVRLLPGRLVPGTRYRIVKWLGEGGMGVVYEAEHVDIERRVALKILRVDASLDPTLSQRFRDEARAASKIGSENIVEVYDFGELPDGRLMFAMELLEGHSLVEELDHVPIEPARLIAIMRQVCKGLAAAHSVGIVHRDIKPENILLTSRNGRPDQVKIVDFGIARILSGPEDQESTAAGTPHYMAPEQCTGMPYDGRLDMYALGCTAYELLVGDPPFMSDDVEAILHAHLEQEAVPPNQRVPSLALPDGLEQLLMKCLAKHADDRFANMHDLEAALCEAQIAAGLETQWDDLPLPDVEPDRRAHLLRDMPSPEDALREEPGRRWLWPVVAVGSLLLAGTLGFALMSAADPTDDETVVVEELTDSAREAAARAYYVYPPIADPEGATAYRKIRELEGLDGALEDLGDDRAVALRSDFATTLVRLGDRYWDREGGRAFATDYYAQALVFTPDNARARERAPLLPGELADLRRKAETGGFSSAELEAARPLVAMSKDTDEEVIEELQELVANSEGESVSRDSRVENLIRKAGQKPRPKKVAPPPVIDPFEDSSPEIAQADPVEEQVVDAPTPPPMPTGKGSRDKQAAAELVKQARKERRRGRVNEAERLFHQALAADYRSAAALIGLSYIYFDRSKHQNAVQYAERAVRYAPKNGGYRIQLGDTYFKIMRYQEAQAQYEQAKRLRHRDADARLKTIEKRLGR